MPDYHFIAQWPLGGYNRDFGGLTIAQIPGCRITSLGIAPNRQTGLAAALPEIFNIQAPKTGGVTTSGSCRLHLLGLQETQWFLVSETPISKLALDRLKTHAYLADQSDSWVMLWVTGEKCRAVLARICPVDLHPAKFPTGKVVRTLMAHLGVIIYRQGDGSFCLLAPSASAESFVQALEAAALSVLGEKR